MTGNYTEVSKETLRDIDLVFVYLYNRKEEAIQALFGHSCEAYQKEWRDRSIVAFWCHLDSDHSRKLVQLARKMGRAKKQGTSKDGHSTERN